MASEVDSSQDPTDIDSQAEMILYKFRDLERATVKELQKQFVAFLRPEQISSGDFELEEDQAHRLFEARGETKTVVEMRELFADIDVDKNHKLSFLEWCCGAFKLSWAELHAGVVVDEAKYRDMALAAAAEAEAKLAAAEKAKADAAEEERRKKEEEEKKIEEEKKLTGVAAKAAFFKRAADATGDSTMTNEQKIKADAARRRAEREARAEAEKAREKAASASDDAKKAAEIEEAENRKRYEEERAAAEAAEKKKAEDEAAERARKRAEFKARNEAMFGGKKS